MEDKTKERKYGWELTINLVATVIISTICTLIIVAQQHHVSLFATVFSAMYILSMAFFSLPVYFNLFSSVRNSLWLSALSFFILPVIITIWICTELADDFTYHPDLFLATIIPFLAIHIYCFLNFHRKINIKITKPFTISKPVFLSSVIIVLLTIISLGYKYSDDKANSCYEGYVYDYEDMPLADVTVREDIDDYHETITDPSGYFALVKDPKTMPGLIFIKEGYKTDTVEPMYSNHGETLEYRFFHKKAHIYIQKEEE